MLKLCLPATALTALLLTSSPADAVERRLPLSPAAESPAAEGPEPNAPALDLGGDWLLTLPAGFQYRVTFESLGEGFYRVRGANNLAGKYEQRGDRLLMSEPDRERHTVCTWQILNANTLTLIDETGASGARYAGATLGRQIDPEAELPVTVPTVSSADLESGLSTEQLSKSDPGCFLALGREGVLELTGVALTDDIHGLYLEGNGFLVFVRYLKAWPDDVEGETITASGTVVTGKLRDDSNEFREVTHYQLRTWQKGDGPVQHVIRK